MYVKNKSFSVPSFLLKFVWLTVKFEPNVSFHNV